MRDFIKNNWQILLVETLVISAFALFFGKFGDIMIDSFREVYIPQQILKGKCIYKDIFVIYPPLAYLINAFLMKIFGAGINILYLAGLFSTMGIFFFTYKIAKIFLNEFESFTICIFLITGLALSPNVFNSFFPYSYGIVYGILFVIASLYFALNKKFPLTYLFYSLAILCKYEFILLLPLLIFWSKNKDWKKCIIAFFSPIILTSVILATQGLRLEDIKATFEIINIMSGTKTLYWFYSVMGLTFRFELIPIYFVNIAKFLIPVYWIQYQEIIIWILPLILIAGLLNFRKLKKNEAFFILATLLISTKVFFALNLQSYGVYFLPFALISLLILVPVKLKKYISVLLIIWSLIIGGYNIKTLSNKEMSLKNIVQYIKQNTKNEDKVLVLPECLGINILSDRNSDNKFYSLIPLYVETFGEDLIIKRLEITKPKYIIINNYDTSAYYYKEFGKDYAQNILKWIEQNYTVETTIKDKWLFSIYRKS